MMRTIKELLELVLKYIGRKIISHGLCKVIDNMSSSGIITWEEQKSLANYMFNNQPVRKFYDFDGNSTDDITQFWYKIGEKEPRVEWLKKHIELNIKNNERN